MARSGRTSVKLEEKVLEFEFEILKVQYNKQGQFYLKLSIQNAHRTDLLPKVTVDVNDSGVQKPGIYVTTDTVKSTAAANYVTYETKKFKYNLPKGFCKNDGKYDVYLLVEVFQHPLSRRTREPEKMGEAKFAIYPRTDLPRANLFVRKGEDYYNYSGLLTLLRPLTRASISMHCGRLSYNVAFHEYREPGFVFHESGDEDTVLSPVPEEPPQPDPPPKTNEVTPKKENKASILRQANKQPPPPLSPPQSSQQFSAAVLELCQNVVPVNDGKLLLEYGQGISQLPGRSPYFLTGLRSLESEAKVKSVDRTTQWTPQETYELWSPDTFDLSREETFNISVPSSPLLENPNHPTNKEVSGISVK